MLTRLRTKIAVVFGMAAMMIVINVMMTFFYLEKHERTTAVVFERYLPEGASLETDRARQEIEALNDRFRMMLMTITCISIIMLVLIAFVVIRNLHAHQDEKGLDELKRELSLVMRRLDSIIRRI